MSLGFEPTDREFEKLGYDIESRVPGTGRLRFIEVKGRVSGAATITVTEMKFCTLSISRTNSFSRSWSSMDDTASSFTMCAGRSIASQISVSRASTTILLSCWPRAEPA